MRVLDEKDVDKHFRYAYCATAHSRQGTSITGNMTIHEWNKDYLGSKEWLWTAMTRCRDFNKVYFFQNEKANEAMFRNLVSNYFKHKGEGYKGQDRKANREIDKDNYVDEKWCLQHFKNCCCNCGVKFYLDTRSGKLTTNFTAQRIDGNTGHSIDNCKPFCYQCTCRAH